MNENQRTFLKRVISGVLAGMLVFGLSYFGGRPGMYVVCTVAIVLGIREYSRMAFTHWNMPSSIKHLYWVISLLYYAAMMDHFEQGLLWFAFANILFFSGTLWLVNHRVKNDDLLPALALGTFGMLYCVLFPSFVLKLIQMEHGEQWFLFLLLVVFFGDTFAYFGGRWLGRRKLMKNVSPNKTWEGAISGLVGSSLGGTVHMLLAFNEVSWFQVVLFCFLCGFFAQSGDLLMSLVKRVAQVKDSGHIMPGHGGILDRLDGIFIACPMVYAFALYVRPIAE